MSRIKSLILVLLIIIIIKPLNAQMRQIHFDPGGNPFPIPIKNVSFYSPSQGYIASGDTDPWVAFTSDTGRTLIKRSITSSNVNYNGYNVALPFLINGVKAFNQDTLLVYGSFNITPAILRSVNGGITFTLVFHSSAATNGISQVYDMIFPENNNVGFAVDGYRVLRTTNSGINWTTMLTDPDPYFGGLDATDNLNVFAFSNNRSILNYTGAKLIKTSNAGITWQTISLPYSGIASVDFYTLNKGWLNVIDNNQDFRIYYTNNGGATWVQKNEPTATPNNPFVFYEMQFINDSTGFGISDLYQTYKTSDSGKVWEPIARNINYQGFGHEDLFIINNSQLWAAGWDKLIELNTNLATQPLPKAYFRIDTTNVYLTNIVSLKNYSKPTYQYKWYVNNILTSTSYNATYSHNNSSTLDSVVLIVTSSTISDTLKQYQNFPIPNLSNIYSFTPTTGSIGTEVNLKGINFTSVTGVSFGGVSAQTFTILSDTTIRATVAIGATGNVTVSKPGGGFSKPGFIYYPPPTAPPPTVSSFSPAFGPVGTTVTISGSSFSSTSANNIVFFGDTRASVNSSTSSQIVCVVPVGASYKPISVLNKSTSLSGYSLKPFNVTFADSSNFTSNSFVSVLEFPTGPNYSARKVNSKDLDDDGKPDLIYSFHLGDSVTILRNTSIGNNFSFAAPQTIAKSTWDTETGDLDGDGLPELLYCVNVNTPSTNSGVSIRKNKSLPGQIIFDTAYKIYPQTEITDIELNDIDGDGRNDVIVATWNDLRGFFVARNTSVPGFLSFAAFKSFLNGEQTYNIATGDIDGDGKPDVVTASDTHLSCFRNTSTPGNVSFAPKIDISTSGSFRGLASLTDFNGDNKLDIIFFTSGLIQVFINTSSTNNISFNLTAFSTTVTGISFPGYLSNLSGDAKPDLLWGSNNVSDFFMKKNVSATTTINTDPEVSPFPQVGFFINDIVSADLNLDGKVDIVFAGSNAYKVSIYENRVGEPITYSVCVGSFKQIFAGLSGTTFQWQQDAGSGFVNISDNSTFSGTQTGLLAISNILLGFNGNKFRCVVNGYFGTTFILQVNPQVTPSVTIITPTTNTCYGTAVTFTATAVNGGTNPSYQWQVNGVNTGTNSPTFTTNTLTNNSQVKVIVSSSNMCASPNSGTSNTITMTVTGNPISVSIAASSSPVCPNSAATFTATPTNGGASPSYQWQVNGINVGTNSPTFNASSLSAGSVVTVILSVITSCSTVATATSNSITVNNSVTPSVSISGSTTICAGSTASFSSSAINGGSSPAYQWQVNGINAGTNSSSFSTTSLTNSAQVKLIMTSNAACTTTPTATSNIITVTVMPQVTPAVTISGNTTVNAGQSTTLNAVFTNGGNSPLLIWQDSTSAHTWQSYAQGLPLTVNYTAPHNGAKMRCELQSNAQCRTVSIVYSNILVFTVNTVTAINPVPGSNYGIRYYPNPVNTVFFIDSLKLSDKWQTLEIKSIEGKFVIPIISIINRTTTVVNVERLPGGLYIAVLRRKNGIPAYLKFIK